MYSTSSPKTTTSIPVLLAKTASAGRLEYGLVAFFLKMRNNGGP